MAGSERRTFPNEVGELRPMSEWLRRVAAGAGLDSALAWKAELCLNEAAANIMMYAGDSQPITIEVEPTDRALRLTIRDSGRPFNPLDAAPPPLPHSIEQAPIGGLGIQLMRSSASDVRYRRDGQQNVLVLTFDAAQPAGGGPT
jgi:anti-sigma regulatory factor (Ser/Thr protein kinase)